MVLNYLKRKKTLMVCNWPRLKMVGDRCHTDRDTRNFIYSFYFCIILKNFVHIWKYIREVVEGLWRERKIEDH